jgi:DNA invertase Pin-like site-specific DNA recombinase
VRAAASRIQAGYAAAVAFALLAAVCSTRQEAGSMRLVGYTRVSTEEQSFHGLSLDAQRARIAEHCGRYGHELVDLVEEPEASGSVALAVRPGGRRLVELVRRRRVAGIVACRLDRLFRNCADCLANVDVWNRRRIALHLLDLGGSAIDTSSAMGKFFLTVMAGAAELERNQISERTSAVLQHKAERGEYTGGEPPFGFRLAEDGVRLVEDSAEQRVLARARELRGHGTSLRRIAAQLAAEGLTSRSGGGFAVVQVQRLLGA